MPVHGGAKHASFAKQEAQVKHCSRCNTDKPLDEFPLNKRNKDGHNCYCIPCAKSYNDEYRLKNAEHLKKRKQEYYQENKEHIDAKNIAWAQSHPEQVKIIQQNWQMNHPGLSAARAQEYYEAHKEQILQDMAAYYLEHREEKIEAAAQWAKENPNKVRESRLKRYHADVEASRKRMNDYFATHPEVKKRNTALYAQRHPERRAVNEQRRRARKAQAPINDLTAEQWNEILLAYNYICVYCPDDCKECETHTHNLTQDHITPVVKGGSYTVQNIVPACQRCNVKKHDGPPLKIG